MELLIYITMFGWPLLVLALFALVPARRAVAIALVGGWLFLPNAGFTITGLPDYGKLSAISFAILLGVGLFDSGVVMRVRFRWFDLPILIWCLCPFATSISNGQTLYDGASIALNNVVYYGIPYFLGRVYFSDSQGMRELAWVVLIGGLIYVPFGLIETRLSPQFHYWTYGSHADKFAKVFRLGGYRPVVFLDHGITFGLWMAVVTVLAMWLWWSRGLRQLWGIPMAGIAIGLLLLTPFWRATNGMGIVAIGLVVLFLTQRLRTPVFLVGLAILPPLYVAARVLTDWRPNMLVEVLEVADAPRASSLEYRLDQETILVDHAKQRLLLGWGGYGRSRPSGDPAGGELDYGATPDSLWVVTLGKHGLLGVVSLGLVLVMPVLLLLRRLGAREWSNPIYAPSTGMAVIVALFAVDCMFNSKITPVYFCVAGGVMALRVLRRKPAPAVSRRAAQPVPPRPHAQPIGYARRGLAVGVAVGVLTAITASAWGDGDQRDSWKRDWEVQSGFSMAVDTEGFEYPSAIAFVPNPGDGPKDPLYFVTELRGKLKVVTNDRTVHTFAEGFFDLLPPPSDIPEGKVPEVGMAGMCLDEEHGYVFVSFTSYQEGGGLRNNIIRFESEPRTFSLEPKGSTAFTEIFEDQPASGSHMIGPMAVHDGLLYVNVGDAMTAGLTQDLNYTVGKILRMTLDGEPVPDNPFYRDGDKKNAINYVWAYGFRNPFGLEIVNDQVFVTDVGPSVDRFVHVRRGWNYGYDGSDWSISSHADVVFAPSVSPVQIDYLPEGEGPFPASHQDRFYVAASGLQAALGPADSGGKSILMIDYDFKDERVIGRPRPLLAYRGKGAQMPVSIAFGPDGLYMTPLHPDSSGRTAIFKITHDPDREHPFIMDRVRALMGTKGCIGCHRDARESPGPSLERGKMVPRLMERLHSEQYVEESRKLDRLETEPFQSYRQAREEVRRAEDLEKVRLWVKYRLLEPRFDDPDAVMPNMGLTESEAALIADHLVAVPEPRTLTQRAKDAMVGFIPKPRQRHLLMFFAAGGGAGFFASLALFAVVRQFRRPKRSSDHPPLTRDRQA